MEFSFSLDDVTVLMNSYAINCIMAVQKDLLKCPHL
jgi:hypothetical protein